MEAPIFDALRPHCTCTVSAIGAIKVWLWCVSKEVNVGSCKGPMVAKLCRQHYFCLLAMLTLQCERLHPFPIVTIF